LIDTITVGNCVWRIICLISHFLYSSSQSRDGLHHQRQAILRNASDPSAGVVSLSSLAWAWRNRSSHPYKRCLPLLVLAAICSVGFLVASAFSSLISSAVGNEVLLDGSMCGGWAESTFDGTDRERDEEWMSQFTSKVESASSQALQCYSAASGSEWGSGNCGAFVKRRLKIEVDRSAPCPFAARVCRSQTRNLLLDTGWLDSNDDFGINAPVNERWRLRRRLQCAPLATDGYRFDVVSSPNTTFRQFYYGADLRPSVYTPNTTYTLAYQDYPQPSTGFYHEATAASESLVMYVLAALTLEAKIADALFVASGL
jgi:hypothetical protein